MHRTIMPAPTGLQIDHIDGDGLNNRRSNLRLATNAQNQHNRRFHAGNKSGFKGVFWDPSRSQWMAQITLNGEKVYLGRFRDISDAVAARAKAGEGLHGAFARQYENHTAPRGQE